jgi:DNA polymerase-1
LKALIDADIVGFSCAAYNAEFSWAACQEDIDQLMKRIIETTDSDSYLAVLTGSNNFRYEIYPEYKANRKDKVKPQYLEDSRAYLITAWGATLTDGYEADDRLGIEQCSEEFGTTVICSIDKDLKQIPGYHYNWRKNERSLVSPLEGLRSLYRSLLTGDTTDNISGIGGIGPVKSARAINDLQTELDMYEVCKAMYGPERLEEMHLNAQLLFILRQEGRMWQPPDETTTNCTYRLQVGTGEAGFGFDAEGNV